MQNDNQNKELWQSIMDKTEQEIITGKFKISFSKYEPILEFPKPPVYVHAYRLTMAFAFKNADRINRKIHRILEEIFGIKK